jgi:uncharacterized membrane protein
VTRDPARPAARLAPDGTTLRLTAPRRLTSAALSLGVALSAACFVLAGVAELLGMTRREASMTDVSALLDGLRALDPWALASLGCYAVVVTPAIGLLATAWEYASIADRRATILALAVLGILAVSVVVAAVH